MIALSVCSSRWRFSRRRRTSVLLVGVGVTEAHPHEESVELSLGQRVGAFVLDRVRSGEHTMNGSGSTNVSPSTVICRSCMASSSADCVFGGVRLISSASSSPANSGPLPEVELAGALVVDERAGQVARQQVGRELGPAELQAERLGERPSRQGLAEPGEVLEQHVTTGEEPRSAPARGLRRFPTTARSTSSRMAAARTPTSLDRHRREHRMPRRRQWGGHAHRASIRERRSCS